MASLIETNENANLVEILEEKFLSLEDREIILNKN